MKRILSIILTVVMLATMVNMSAFAALPQDAAYVTTVTNGMGGNFVSTGMTVTTGLKGSAGKAESDLVFKYETADKSRFTSFGAPLKALMSNTGSVADFEKEYNYLVLEFNIKPEDNSSFGYKSVGQNPYTRDVAPADLDQGRWNKALVYFDYTKVDAAYLESMAQTFIDDSAENKTSLVSVYGQENKDKIAPYSYTFVNGKAIGTSGYQVDRIRDLPGIGLQHCAGSTAIRKDNDGKQSRFFLTGGLKASFDDVNIYYTNTKPDGVAATARPALADGAKFKVADGIITATGAITVADIAAAESGATVVAYTDALFETELSASAKLEEGNVVVIGKDSNYGYYTMGVVNQEGITMLASTKSVFYPAVTPFTMAGTSGKHTVHAKGVAGKKSSDASAYIEIKDDYNEYNFQYVYNHGEHIYWKDGKDYNGKLVVELNYMIDEANAEPAFFLRLGLSSSQFSIGGDLKASHAAYKPNQWNHVKMIYDPAGHGDFGSVWTNKNNGTTGYTNTNVEAGTKLGTVTTYLNGQVYQAAKEIKASASEPYANGASNIYIQGQSKRNGPCKTYLDDVKIYIEEDPQAPIMPALTSTDKYTVENGKITPKGKLTPADITVEGGDITAFADAKYKYPVASAEELLEGDIVVLEKDAMYSYYTVGASGGNTYIKSLTNGVKENGFTYSDSKMTGTTVTGLAGKASDDKALSLVTVPKSDPYISGGGLMATTDGKTYTPYYVVKFNILPENNSYFTLRTANNGSVINAVPASSLNQGKWNSVMIYVDYTGIDPDFDYSLITQPTAELKNIPEQYRPSVCPVGHVFVNGVEVGKSYMATRLQDRFGMINTFYHPSTMALTGPVNNDEWRLSPLPNDGGSTVTIDDLYVYQSNTLPDAAAETSFSPIASSADLTIEGSIAKVGTGNSVKTLKEKYPRYEFVAFTDNSYNVEYDSTIALDDGCALAITDRKGIVAYFDVNINDNSTTLYEANDFEEFGTFANTTKESVSGLAGKASSDTSLKLVSTATASAWEYPYKDTSYKGYIVNEFNIMNNGATKFAVTNSTAQFISAELTARLYDDIWNRVKVVTDRTGGENDGKSITYVNGVAVTNWEDDKFTNSFHYYFESPIGKGIYIDDMRIYQIGAIAETKAASLSGETYLAAGPNFNIMKETKLSDVVSAKYTVAGYTDATLTTPLAQDAIIAPGNVIVIADRYNTMTYFTAKEWTGVTDIVTEMPSSVVGGTIAPTSAPVIGKKGSDTSYQVVPSASEAYFETQWSALDPLSKYLIYDVLVAPAEGGKVTFATDNGIEMSPALSVSENKWNRIINVYNIETGNSDTYVNGERVSADFKTKYKKEPVRDTLRLSLTKTSYVDDIKVYESVLYPEIDTAYVKEAGFNAEDAYVVDADANTITLKLENAGKLKAYFDAEDVSVFANDTFAAPLSAGDEIDNGAVVVIAKDGIYSYYTVCDYEWDEMFIMGKMLTETGALRGVGSETFIAPVTNGGVLYVAQYDEDGNLIKIEMDTTATNGCLVVEFEPENVIDSSVKSFLFEGKESLKPLCENLEFERIVGANILVIGNSFSVDLCTYFRPISEAAGVDFNVFVYDWGGRSINDHYGHWDDTKEELTEFVTANKTSSPALYKNLGGSSGTTGSWTYISIKDSLEKFKYDYIVLQNWGSGTSFYANTDANYEKNWYNMVPLAKHIHDIQPDAEIMIHNTWSFETGNGSFATQAIRDSVAEEITQLNTRCATEAAQLIGLSEPLRLVDSNKVYNTARAYVNEDGLDVFNTTFDKEKHAFYLGTEIPTVPVYDGTTVEPSEDKKADYYYILSDADQAAGRIGLHRDGYHANPAARYLIACNIFNMLSGGKVSGNTFRPGESSLQCSNYTSDNPDADLNDSRSSVVRKKYDPISEEVITLLQKIADSIER